MDRPVTTVIDREKCTVCGLCVQVCPADTLAMEEGKAVVVGDYSLGCDQCAAVCPVDAVRVGSVPPDALTLQCAEADERWLPWGEYDVGGLVRLMRSRRSCRKYKEKPVPREMLDDLVRIGTMAPSGTNSQLWSFTVLPDRDAVMAWGRHVGDFYRRLNRMAEKAVARLYSKLFLKDVLGAYYRDYYETVKEGLREYDEGGRDRLFHGAAAAIVVASKPGASCPSDDCHLATQNILLAAHAMGLGSCLIGFAIEAMKNDRRVQKAIGIPGNHRAYSVIALGWPAVRYQKVTGRRLVEPCLVTADQIPPTS